MKFKVSVIQFQPALADPGENIRRLAGMFDRINDSKLVVMPELANSGYNFRSREEAFRNAEVIGQAGIFQDFLAEMAREKDIYIVAGINEREGDLLYNSAIVTGPSGMVGFYRKLHLFMNEKDFFNPGNAGLPVFDIGDVRIGVMICFDYLFPEPWRIMAQKGADLVCHPSNLITGNPHKCLPGIALMNRIFIATANRIGTEGEITFNGRSLFISPSGDIMGTASETKAEILTCTIDTDLSRNKMITARNHVFGDRRPESYLP